MQSGDGWPSPVEVARVVAVMDELGVQTPTIRSVPAYARSKGGEALEVAAAFGISLDPWQELVLTDGCGVREDGKWAAFEVAGDVARQNGKGAIIETRELAGIFAWGERLIVHSAHEFPTATEAMIRMEDILAGTPEYAAEVKSISRSHGSEGFIFKSGQRLRYRTRTKGGGRGFTIDDTLILDEAMVLQDAFIAALLPTLSSRSMVGNPQVWYFGSAVDQLVHEYGIVFARLRARALAGGDPSLAFFGWSGAPAVDEDGKPVTPEHPMVADLLDDVRAWAQANPASGIRISTEHIENERRSMGPRQFAVERLGIGDWPSTDQAGDSPIKIEKWEALKDPGSRIVGDLCFAFDVPPDRLAASIASAGEREDELAHVEVVEQRRGTGWLIDRLVELAARHEPRALVCDARSAAASFVHELEQELEEAGLEHVQVVVTDAQQHATACGQIFDRVEQRTIRHLGTAELADAVRGAARRPLGDAWGWSRKLSNVNISPLVAVTLALWGLAAVEPDDGEDIGAFMVEVGG